LNIQIKRIESIYGIKLNQIQVRIDQVKSNTVLWLILPSEVQSTCTTVNTQQATKQRAMTEDDLVEDMALLSLSDQLVILSPDDMLVKGLTLLGWTEVRLGRRMVETNIEQYGGIYGVVPSVTAQLFEDLQTTDIEDAKITADDKSVDKLHWALHFLYRYPTETESESTWHKCANTIRGACWFYMEKIRALKPEKIVWPKFKSDDI
jgi:hypothetical protein